MKIIRINKNEIKISGEIRSIDHYREIKEVISDSISNKVKDLNITIEDSFAMTSLVVGYLLKIIHQDKINLTLKIKNRSLIQTLNDLKLIDQFNVVIID